MSRKVKLSYVPHGINPKTYFPITPDHPDWAEFSKFQSDFKEKNGVEFVVFWQNRNIRRKQPGDVILAFRRFCDFLPKEKQQKVCLLMKTQIADENGTDLMAVKKNICPNYKVFFNQELLHPKLMNFFYNLADVTINIASNEGFGLSNAESIMAGTPTITNVTGGLQDQCGFVDDDGAPIQFTPVFPSNHAGTYKMHGNWTKSVFPSNRSLQGSIPTPYIFDDRCKFEDVADAIRYWFDLPTDTRKQFGLEGRNWMLQAEVGLNSGEMCNRMMKSIDTLFETWESPSKFEVTKFKPKQYPDNIGIVF